MTEQEAQLEKHVLAMTKHLPTQMITDFLALSDEEVLRRELSLSTDVAELTHGLWRMVQKRCRVCEPGRSCAHCVAESERFGTLREQMFIFAALLATRATAKTSGEAK